MSLTWIVHSDDDRWWWASQRLAEWLVARSKQTWRFRRVHSMEQVVALSAKSHFAVVLWGHPVHDAERTLHVMQELAKVQRCFQLIALPQAMVRDSSECYEARRSYLELGIQATLIHAADLVPLLPSIQRCCDLRARCQTESTASIMAQLPWSDDEAIWLEKGLKGEGPAQFR